MRLEAALVGVFFAAWLVALADQFGYLQLGGLLPLDFYGYYSTAAATGWLSGNLFVARRRARSAAVRRRLLVIYLFGPPSLFYLLRALGGGELRLSLLTPLVGSAVFAIFFLVPVTLSRTA